MATDPAIVKAYAEDTVVAHRLDRMGQLVCQPDLPATFVELIADARVLVRRHGADLLTRP